MADPQPQTTDQGFLPGLLGKVGGWFGSYDPQAAYGGLLSDPATQQAFRIRELGAAAQAMAQASMPVPYKGGMPWGSFLGSAGGAAATAGDSLIQARLEAAQSEQALQNAAALHAKQLATSEILKNYQDPNSIYNRGGGTGTGTGTGTDGKKLTGPAAIIAGQGGGKAISSTTADTSLPPEARALLDTISGPESDGAYNVRWGGPHGDKTFSDFSQHPNIPEPGPQGDSTAAGRYQIVNSTWKPLQAKYGFSDFTPVTQDQAGWHLAADTYKEQTGRDLLTDLQAGKTDQVTSALHGQWSTLNMGSYGKNLGKYQGGSGASPQTASAAPSAAPPATDLGPQTASGGAYSVPPPPGPPPKPGEYAIPVRAGNVPPPPAAPPMAPSAAPPGGLLKLPDPTSAAPPQLATPPAAGAPGPVTGLLGQQPTQQVAAADAPQLSPAAAAVLQGINRQQAGGGLLASGSVAGDNAVPTGGPSPAAVAQAGPPHTGAAGAAELAGLLAQQPASAAPPTATPYTNAPPVTGQGAPAPAPGPAPGPAPPAPPLAPGGAAPPMPQPVTPSAIPGAPSAQDVRDANRAVILHGIAGIPLPPNIAEIAKFPMVGPTAQATAAGTAAGQQPYQLQQAANKAMWDIYVAQQKPRDPQREGTFAFNPQTGQYTLNRSMIEADGSTHQHISILDQNLKPLSDYDAGPIKASPGAVAAGTAAGTEAGKHAPTGVPGSPLIGTPNFTPSPNAPDPTKPIQTARGTVMPGTDRQTLPSNYVDYDKVQDHWNEWNHDLVTAQTLAGTADAQINMIIQAAKQNETGGGTEARAALGNFLIGNHIVNQDWVNKNITNVGAVQTMLYAQARDTLTTLAAVNKRFTGGEFKITSQSGASPEQLNSANLPILAQDLAKVRQIQGVAENWAQAQRTQYADGSTWRNPLSFVSNWYTMNPLGKLQEQTMQQIGPLAGQTTVPGVPQGATPTGKTIAGWPEYNLPGRTGTYTFPGQWKDR